MYSKFERYEYCLSSKFLEARRGHGSAEVRSVVGGAPALATQNKTQTGGVRGPIDTTNSNVKA